jgi:hypothetical protein
MTCLNGCFYDLLQATEVEMEQKKPVPYRAPGFYHPHYLPLASIAEFFFEIFPVSLIPVV